MRDRLATPIDDGVCVACGPENLVGLGLRFRVMDDGSVRADAAVPARFAGWRGVVHGGIVALMLDEAMAYAAAASGHIGVTGSLRVRFRGVVPIDAPVVITGHVDWLRRGALGVRAAIVDATGVGCATGDGTFLSRGRLPAGARFGTLERDGGT